jgi:hypothetical protein
MMMHDPKKTVSVIMSKMQKDGSTKDALLKPEASTDDTLDSFKAIAEDMLAAIQAGSASDLAASLKACMAEYDSQEDAAPDQGEE